MTIQRQYSLPNCKLIIEGVAVDGADPVNAARPLLSMITNVECHLAGLGAPLAGGRDFLNELVKVVSDYAQDYLSTVPHTARRDRAGHLSDRHIYLSRMDKNRHHLSIQPSGAGGHDPNFPAPTEIDLATVQLFDLVEAIDQFLADAQTVPDLRLTLSPLPKRLVVSQEPMAKRATPVAIGTLGLAAASLAFFFMPPPAPRPASTSQDGATEEVTASPEAASPEAASPEATSPTESPAVSPTAEATTASPTASPTAGESADETVAGTDFRQLPEILEPGELDRLTGVLYEQVNQAWQTTPTFEQPLIYRVGINQDDQIVGYRYEDETAINFQNETPLPNLLRVVAPDSPDAANQRPVAQFRVVFQPDGTLEVSPWYGTLEDDSPATEPAEPEPEAEPEPIQ